MSINDSGQVVGGQYSSINDSGQYVGGAGVKIPNDSPNNQLVSGGTTTSLSYFTPYAINNAGVVAGQTYQASGVGVSYPALYQNGVVTHLSMIPGAGQYGAESGAFAINQHGDALVTVWQNGTSQSYLYHASTGTATDLTALPGGSSFIAAALNNNGQAVGNGFIYTDGTVETLAGLLPASSGWSNLNATGVNDSGEIVGQGTYDGQQVAFMISPGVETPEPGSVVIWGLVTVVAAAQLARKAASRTR